MCPGAVNLHVTSGAILILRELVMGRWRLNRAHDVRNRTVARQAKLIYRAVLEQSRIRRAVRRVTRGAPFRLHRRMFERKRPLLVYVTLDASRVRSGSKPGLLQLEPAVRIVAIAATHRTFQNLVMERR